MVMAAQPIVSKLNQDILVLPQVPLVRFNAEMEFWMLEKDVME